MNLYILDTDHLTLLKRNNYEVNSKVLCIPSKDIFITIVTVEEQLRGRLAIISKVATQPDKFNIAYEYLFESLMDFHTFNILKFDPNAVYLFRQFRQQKIRIGTQDLKIACISISQKAILVTRNSRDFIQVPGLLIEDWSING
jgi:tRNA(fMet)-specific endonuclease VapC